jgi:hypothetical protein
MFIMKTGATRARPEIVTLQGLLLKSDSFLLSWASWYLAVLRGMGVFNTALALVLIKRLL